MRPIALTALAALAALAGCSLVLDEPTPFVEARQDMTIIDRGPLLPDFAAEDAFVARDPLDMARQDAGCGDGGADGGCDGGM